MAGTPASAQEAPTLTLLHGIPGQAVDVVVDGAVVYSNFKVGETQDLAKFAGSTLSKVEVRPAGGTDVLIGPIDVAVPATGNWTVVAYLGADGAPTLGSFENDVAKTDAGKGRLTVVHAAAAPPVDLVVGTERPIMNLANGSSKALELGVATISDAKLAPTGAAPIIDVPSVDIKAGVNLVVFAVGSATNSTLTFLTQSITVGENTVDSSTTTSTTEASTTTSSSTTSTSSSTTSTSVADTSTSSSSSSTSTTIVTVDAATVTLLHGIPGTDVDVVVDGNVVFANFKPGETQDLSLLAGQTLKNLEVRPTGTTTAVIGPIDFEVPDKGNWTAVAHLDADGKPTLNAFENDTEKTEIGFGRLIVVHAAAAPPVDLVVGDERPIKNLPNGSLQALSLKAGTISGAKLAPTGKDPIVDVPTVELEAGTDLVVYAVGSLADNTLTYYTQTIKVGEKTLESSTTSSSVPTSISPPVTGSGRALWILGAVLLATGLMLATAARQRITTTE